MATAVTGKNFPKIIFFIRDFVPSDEDVEKAQAIGPGVVFRNANFVPANPSPGQIEACDGVAGDVPAAYAALFAPAATSEPVEPPKADTPTKPAKAPKAAAPAAPIPNAAAAAGWKAN